MEKELMYRLCGRILKILKMVLQKYRSNDNIIIGRIKNLDRTILYNVNGIELRGEFVDGQSLFPCENFIYPRCGIDVEKRLYDTFYRLKECSDQSFEGGLLKFILESKIESPYRYSGFYHAGFCKEYNYWCLPSWIWTNAALAKTFFLMDDQTFLGVELANLFLKEQHHSGGWIVRFDYKRQKASPVIAPNDSSYIANNCMLEAYKATGNGIYLSSAIKCADWIMSNSMGEINIPKLGYYIDIGKWESDVNIVDVGFTSALFCSLYELTENEVYYDYAKKFVHDYIKLFYIGNGIFATSVDIANQTKNSRGVFSRGLAWALEGLIPFYRLSKDETVKRVITDTIEFLLSKQSSNGGWIYNLSGNIIASNSGYDCKGIPVIAESLLNWHEVTKDERLLRAVSSAIDWCKCNAYKDCNGGIGLFSYDYEGAIVYKQFTSTAFTYANAYLLRLIQRIYG